MAVYRCIPGHVEPEPARASAVTDAVNITPRSALLLRLFGAAEPAPEPASPPIVFVCSSPQPQLIHEESTRYIPRFRQCYERARLQTPDLTGSLTVRLTVHAGLVSDTTIENSTLGDEALHACVTDVFWMFRFSSAESQQSPELVVRYPLRFVPAE